MKKYALIIICIISGEVCFSQNLTFSNPHLKSLLLTEKTVDIDGNGIADTFIDVNNDNEIQLSEALAVENLVIYPTHPNLTNVTDLHQFKRLKKLSIIGGNSGLVDVSSLGLDSLIFIEISEIDDMHNIDLSDLPNLKSIILEGLDRLKNLNLNNGSYATEKFSLFYTEFIEHSCVDSISAEYDYVSQHTKGTTTIDCSLGITENKKEEFSFYPNPAKNILNIVTPHKNNHVEIRDVSGREVLTCKEIRDEKIDISELNSGMYFLIIKSENGESRCYLFVKS